MRQSNPILEHLARFFWKYVGVFVLVCGTMATVRSVIVDWDVVPTASMSPAIAQGGRILVNNLAYRLRVPFTTSSLLTWAEPQRGDVVVFSSPRDGKRLVKRVVGIPGDAMEGASGPRTIPTGQYFLVGDNRDHSLDSRQFGLVESGRIMGRVVTHTGTASDGLALARGS